MLVTKKLTKLTILWLSLFIGLVFYFGFNISVVDAAPTLQINYQGKLTDLADDPVADGLYQMEFFLCDALESGTCLWTESRTSTKVQVANGLFSVMLGQISPLESLDFNQALYLEVKVGTSSLETLSPRKIIGSVPSAFEAQRLSGLASSSFLRSDATNASALFENSSSTNFFANFLTAITGWFTDLFFGNATGTNMTVGTLAATSSATLASTTITGQLTVGSLTGLLSATNGIVATMSTSSLGILPSASDGNILYYNSGWQATSSLTVATSTGYVGIGTTIPNNRFQVYDYIDFGINTDYNTRIGYQAGKNIVTGAKYNTFLGYQAGLSSSTASSNTADYNTAIGYKALFYNTSGQDNSAIGYTALAFNTSGKENTALGNFAGSQITTGNANTFLGYDAGYEAGQKVDAINSMALGANTYTSKDNQIVIGDDNIVETLLKGNVGIGIANPSQKLEVAGTVSSTGLQVNGVATVSNYIDVASSSLGYWLGGQKFISVPSGNNSAIGLNALAANTTGTDNTAVGRYALQSNTVGFYDTAVGVEALKNNINGDRNTAVGVYALRANTSGFQNTANGFLALSSNVDGGYNTAVGTFALWQHGGGYYNIALGTNAGQALTSGHYNTFLGESAGYTLSSGDRNILIGYDADVPGSSQSNFLNIGNTIYGNLSSDYVGIGVITPSVALEVAGTVSSTALHINNLTGLLYATSGSVGTTTLSAFGVTSSQWVTNGSDIYYDVGNVGIGLTTPSTALEVAGTVSSTGLQINGVAIVSNYIKVASSSLGYWLGGQRFISIPDDNNLAIGHNSLAANTTGLANLGIGINTLASNQGGSDNLAFGVNALIANVSGNHNVAVGVNSLISNISGQFNIALGTQALASNTASANIAIGYNTLDINTTGIANVAIGHYALTTNVGGDSNVAVGANALIANISGNSNVAVGASALYSNQGISNVALGLSAGYDLVSGNNNVFLGANAGDSISTGTNNILIGHNTNATSSVANNFLNIGDIIYGNLSTDYIGIGIPEPTTALEVAGTVSSTGLQVNGNATVTGQIVGGMNSRFGDATRYWQVESLDLTATLLGNLGYYPMLTPYSDGVFPRLGAIANELMIFDKASTSGSDPQFTFTSLYGAGSIGHFKLDRSENEFATDIALNVDSYLKINQGGSYMAQLGNDASLYGGFLNSPVANVYLAYNDGSNDYAIYATGDSYLNGNVTTTGDLTIGALTGLLYAADGLVGTTSFSVLGVTSSQWVTNGSDIYYGMGNVGIGTASPTYLLDVNGDINIAAGSSLRYNGSLLAQASTSLGNYFFAGASNLTTVGTNNLAIGNGSLSANTTGTVNVAVGNSALISNTTGEWNNAFGTWALFDNTTGVYNQAFGGWALGSNQTGSHNVGIGEEALNMYDLASYNTALGNLAGAGYAISPDTTSTGSNNLFLGYGSGPLSSSSYNAIAIGSNARVGGSNMMVLGGEQGSKWAVNVGIGVTAPSTALEAAGTVSSTGLRINGNAYFDGNVTTTGNQAISGNLSVAGASTLATTTVNGSLAITDNYLVSHQAGVGGLDYEARLTDLNYNSAGYFYEDDSGVEVYLAYNDGEYAYALITVGNSYLDGRADVNQSGDYSAILGDGDNLIAGSFSGPSVDTLLAFNDGTTIWGIYTDGDAYFDGNATTTGTSHFGGEAEYINVDFEPYRVNDALGNIPWLRGRSLDGAGGINVFGIDTGLFIRETGDASFPEPTIIFLDNGDAEASRIYANTDDDSLMFGSAAGGYIFDNDVSISGNASVDGLGIGGAAAHNIGLNITPYVNYLPTDDNDAYGMMLAPLVYAADGYNAYGAYINPTIVTGVGTNHPLFANLYVDGGGLLAGTITDYYGLYVDEPQSSYATNKIGAYIGGNVGIKVLRPAVALDVSGTVSSTGLLVTGNVGIGTSTPNYLLHLSSSTASTGTRIFMISTSTDVFSVDGGGNIRYKGNLITGSADYAEYFYSRDTDLVAGEAVCVDVAKDNAVVRCSRAGDDNIMGIVSTRPAIVGNAKESYENNLNYKIVAMLGQIPAKASNENGEIRPGDYLTAASVPGYVMKAGAGDATVGVALEGLSSDNGTINVMISRRNKSLTVEQVEDAVTQRITDMELEDEVNIMLADTISNYDFTDDIAAYMNPFLASVDAKLTLLSDTLALKVGELASSTLGADASLASQILAANDLISLLSGQVSTTAGDLSVTNEKLEGLNIMTLANDSRLTALELSASSSIADLQTAIINLSLQPATSSAASANIFDSLAVNGDSQFNGIIRVIGDAEFAGKVTVRGQVAFGGDTVGQAKILSNTNPSATTTVQIAFEQVYSNLPIITVTPIDYDGNWKLSHVATTGFDIIADPIPDRDVVFNWHAFSSLPETKLFVSDGSSDLINIAAADKIIEFPPAEEIVPEITPITESSTTAPVEQPVAPVVEVSPEPETAPTSTETEVPAAPLEEVLLPAETVSQPEQTPVADPVSVAEPVR